MNPVVVSAIRPVVGVSVEALQLSESIGLCGLQWSSCVHINEERVVLKAPVSGVTMATPSDAACTCCNHGDAV